MPRAGEPTRCHGASPPARGRRMPGRKRSCGGAGAKRRRSGGRWGRWGGEEPRDEAAELQARERPRVAGGRGPSRAAERREGCEPGTRAPHRLLSPRAGASGRRPGEPERGWGRQRPPGPRGARKASARRRNGVRRACPGRLRRRGEEAPLPGSHVCCNPGALLSLALTSPSSQRRAGPRLDVRGGRSSLGSTVVGGHADRKPGLPGWTHL
ncbi:uncharacterized protein [Vulpes vulpes]|uniref:Uncharacterized protein n=1 Tax=Vulpes vulpes TaxID=9627 RepID=A0ABM4YX47_VULVU